MPPPPTRRALLTGAAGFIGSHAAEGLLDCGFHALGVDSFRSGKPENLEAPSRDPRFQFEEADARDADRLAALVRAFRPEVIVHLAALVSVQESVEDPEANFQLNVALTHRMAELARREGVPRVVFASSAAVYGEPASLPLKETDPARPLSPYGAAKSLSEQILAQHARTYGLAALSLRFFNVYGKRQNPRSPYAGVISIFAERLRSGRPLTLCGDGRQSRDFVHVDDVARIVAQAADPAVPGGVYNVCSGQSVSLLDLVAALEEILQTKARIERQPARPGDIRHSLGDPAALRRAFGRESFTPLPEGLRHLLCQPLS